MVEACVTGAAVAAGLWYIGAFAWDIAAEVLRRSDPEP